MSKENLGTAPAVETPVTEETVTTTVEETKPVKTFTQEEVNGIVKKQEAKLAKKLEVESTKNLTLEERVKKMEDEKVKFEAEASIKASLSKTQTIEANKSALDAALANKVNPNFIKQVEKFTSVDINLETMTTEEINTIIDASIKELPGVAKGTSTTTTKLNKAESLQIQKNDPITVKEVKEEIPAAFKNIKMG